MVRARMAASIAKASMTSEIGSPLTHFAMASEASVAVVARGNADPAGASAMMRSHARNVGKTKPCLDGGKLS